MSDAWCNPAPDNRTRAGTANVLTLDIGMFELAMPLIDVSISLSRM
jgi:hypothetical protein